MASSQPLALALACAGLFTPCVVSAAELNRSGLAIDDLNRYSSTGSLEQVTSISQFSDVRPTDWAYQALSNLIERYGCVAGYPDGTYKG
ncbi:S-layer homology domain-containing protein, partial [Cyanobium sp. CH-040]|uniref:S-layer homology domain-containing protein n=1 Tax=Cyanobium sp. CH-040 TaxID=2823708 RepID=UPI0020CBF7DE